MWVIFANFFKYQNDKNEVLPDSIFVATEH